MPGPLGEKAADRLALSAGIQTQIVQEALYFLQIEDLRNVVGRLKLLQDRETQLGGTGSGAIQRGESTQGLAHRLGLRVGVGERQGGDSLQEESGGSRRGALFFTLCYQVCGKMLCQL